MATHITVNLKRKLNFDVIRKIIESQMQLGLLQRGGTGNGRGACRGGVQGPLDRLDGTAWPAGVREDTRSRRERPEFCRIIVFWTGTSVQILIYNSKKTIHILVILTDMFIWLRLYSCSRGVSSCINICVQTVSLKWQKPNTNKNINNYIISRSMQKPKRRGLYQANTSFSNVALLIRVVIKKSTEL